DVDPEDGRQGNPERDHDVRRPVPEVARGTTMSHSVARASRSSGPRVLASYSARRPGSFAAWSASAPGPGRWSLSFTVISVPPRSSVDQAHQPSRAGPVVSVSAGTRRALIVNRWLV